MYILEVNPGFSFLQTQSLLKCLTLGLECLNHAHLLHIFMNLTLHFSFHWLHSVFFVISKNRGHSLGL